jgi:hypothetical protein
MSRLLRWTPAPSISCVDRSNQLERRGVVVLTSHQEIDFGGLRVRHLQLTHDRSGGPQCLVGVPQPARRDPLLACAVAPTC